MKPQRIQRKRVAGFDLQAESVARNGLPCVSVTRPGPYGNPLVVGRDGTAAECKAKFRKAWDDAIACAKRDRTPYMPFGKPIYLGPLVGKNLACFCKEDALFCHGDDLIELAAEAA